MYDKKYQIFVSSTYTDLAETRNKVIETILSMYHIPIGMEMFSAADDEQWGIIKDTIDISDYYIVIIGHRYGSVTKEGVSYTEKEYDYAKKNDIPVMAFLREEGVATKPHEREEDVEKREKLNRFRKKAIKSKMCDFWKNKDELANKVGVSLMKEFTRTPRVGWIRADRAISPEMSKEMTELSKENRELREEVSKLKSKLNKDKPRLGVLFNGGKEELNLELNKFEEFLEFEEIKFEEIPSHLQDYINKEDIEFYNNKLPSETEINTYNDEKELFWRKTESNKILNMTIINDGSKKANEVYIDIKFPKEALMIMRKNNIKELEPPKLPDIPENPLKKAKKKYTESIIMGSNSVINHAQNALFNNFNPTIPHIPTPNPNHSSKIENNKLNIWIKDILHTRAKKFNNKFVIVPLKKGDYKIKVSIICEEFKEEEVMNIPVSIV